MNYQQARLYLDSLHFRGIKMGLGNIETLLGRLGDPHKGFSVIHIAGTNGKGSTCAMISSVLTCSGVSSGLYVSPHIESVRERIQLNGQIADKTTTADLVSAVKQAAEHAPCIRPTYFEFLTAMSFLCFARARVRVAVVEVGLGGRFDSTNIVDPEVSVITTIAMDHMESLGRDKEHIAIEKSGIIKQGRPLVLAVRDVKAAETIISIAKEKSAPVHLLARDFQYTPLTMTETGERFDYRSDTLELSDVDVGLVGRRQIDNASVAIRVAEIMRMAQIPVDERHIRNGLATLRLAGRFERVMSEPVVILDGAHNPDATSELCNTLLERFGPGRVDFIFGAMGDKDYASMLRNLRPSARSFACFSPDVPRAADPDKLAAAQTDSSIPTSTLKSAREVVRLVTNAPADAIFCVTGSFYTLGEIRPAIRKVARTMHHQFGAAG